ncbi:MAG: glycosyltransferase family 2 protein [Oscillospiraceae bacterium]|nr:glycosyltransferase family 2 protein [Oscillospiraceae bacterium]
MRPAISIVMPTYNAEDVLERTLQSIEAQSIAGEIEVIVVDGGSTDRTLEIARTFGATVLSNPRRLPEYGKQIGMQSAQGKYLVRQDADERYVSSGQLERRLEFLQHNPSVRCMVCDRMLPSEAPRGLSVSYACAFGDPFTYFVYRSKGSALQTFKHNIADRNLLKFAPGDILPIGDGGTTLFDLDWIKRQFPDHWGDLQTACSLFSVCCEATHCCGCIEKDDVVHDMNCTFQRYLSKLRFRVVNNLFDPMGSGYSARIQGEASGKLRRRKLLFIGYVASVIGPIWSSVYLAARFRDARMLLHFFYTYFVVFNILILGTEKLLGIRKSNQSYG